MDETCPLCTGGSGGGGGDLPPQRLYLYRLFRLSRRAGQPARGRAGMPLGRARHRLCVGHAQPQRGLNGVRLRRRQRLDRAAAHARDAQRHKKGLRSARGRARLALRARAVRARAGLEDLGQHHRVQLVRGEGRGASD